MSSRRFDHNSCSVSSQHRMSSVWISGVNARSHCKKCWALKINFRGQLGATKTTLNGFCTLAAQWIASFSFLPSFSDSQFLSELTRWRGGGEPVCVAVWECIHACYPWVCIFTYPGHFVLVYCLHWGLPLLKNQLQKIHASDEKWWVGKLWIISFYHCLHRGSRGIICNHHGG